MAHPHISTYSSANSDFDSVIDSDFGSYHSANSVALLDDLYTPRMTLRDLRRIRRSPIQSTTSCYDYKQIRRRPSLANLAGREPEAPPLPLVMPARLGEIPPSDQRPSLLPPFEPWSCIQPTKYPSPSLTSSASSPPSTPSRSPVQPTSLRQWKRDEDEGAYISTKRKFSPLRQAKRLPHRPSYSVGGNPGEIYGNGGDNGLWEVHAAIIHPPIAPGKLDERIYGRVSYQNGENGCDLDTNSSTPERYPFPVPSGNGYFGPASHGPLPRATTVMYRGTSFDVVNPHASLMSQQDLETPGDIEQVLDHYLEELTDQPVTKVDMPSQRGRILYDDAAAAHSNITRHPSAVGTSFRSRLESTIPEQSHRISVRSNPFDLTLGDGEAGTANRGNAAVPDNGTLNSIIGKYEYTQPTIPEDAGGHTEHTPPSIEHGLGIEGLTSPGTYGETNELLQITPEATMRTISSHPVLVCPSEIDHRGIMPSIDVGGEDEHDAVANDEEKDHTTNDAADQGSSPQDSTIPAMWADVDVVSAPRGILTNVGAMREMLRSSSSTRVEDDVDWQTIRSNSREVRSSQESYANTSAGASENFVVEYPLPERPPGPNPESPKQGFFGASFTSSVSGVEQWSARPPSSALLCQTRSAVAEEIENRRQTMETIDMLKNEVVSSGVGSPAASGRHLSGQQRKANSAAIDQMRRSNPSAFRRASDYLVEEYSRHTRSSLGTEADTVHLSPRPSEQSCGTPSKTTGARRKLTPVKPKYSPSESCHRIVENATDPSIVSSRSGRARRPSLDSTDIATGNFRFNESTGTFQTYGRETEGRAIVPWDATNNAARSLAGMRPPPNMLRPRSAKELLPQNNGKKSASRPRRALELNGYELQTLRSVRSQPSRAPRRGRMSDQELAESEPRWSVVPNFRFDGPLSRHAVRTPIEHIDFSGMRMLQNPDRYRNSERYERQDRISKRYLAIATPFPPFLVLYGLGALDFLIRRETKGNVTGMSKKYKKSALWLCLPLCMMVYCIIAIVVAYEVAVKVKSRS